MTSAEPGALDSREPRVRELVSRLYDGLTDRHGEPMFEHMRQVAEHCEPTNRIIGWLHDVAEDGLMSLDELQRDVPLSSAEREALGLLTRPPSLTYRDYIERIAASQTAAGQIARSVKRADLSANLARPPHPDHPKLLERYLAALERLGG
ncbi:MAG: hypothetical protein WBM00_01955 [Solirubrobacterales bacterium]